MRKILNIGHRGAPFHFFENTIESFHKAIELGADGIELDVQVCKSGELVVFHDVGLDRHANNEGFIRDLDWAQLQSISLPKNGRISTLPEILDALGKDIYYFIELKDRNAMIPAIEMIENYTAKGWKNLILISYLQEARIYSQSIQLAATFSKLEAGDIETCSKFCNMLIVDYDNITKEHIEKAHSLDMQLIACVVNDPADMKILAELGVDGIMSDYPERLYN